MEWAWALRTVRLWLLRELLEMRREVDALEQRVSRVEERMGGR